MSNSSYRLQRHYVASARLNVQHWITEFMQGYLVQPSIPTPGPGAAVADVGAGTGAWVLELARKLPETTFDAIDIDLTQLTHKDWLPRNVGKLQMDIYDPVPDALLQKYDLLNIRFFHMVVRNQDPSSVINQAKKMVKPEGYIQWTEGNIWGMKVIKARDDIASGSTEKLVDAMKKLVLPKTGSPTGWAINLPQYFESCGLTDVKRDHHETKGEIASAMHDFVLMGFEEVSNFAPNGVEIRALLDDALVELAVSGRALAIVTDLYTVVGRVPSA